MPSTHPRPGWLSASIALAVAVNAALLAGYFWSCGGQTTHLRIEAHGDTFQVRLDGRDVASAMFDAPPEGAISIKLEDTDLVPSLPEPRGIDRVRVTDLDDGKVLADEDFSSLPDAAGGWRVTQGLVQVHGGVLGTGGGDATIEFSRPELRNVRLDITFRNITTSFVSVRGQDDGSRVEYSFRTFRHLDNNLTFVRTGEPSVGTPLPPVESSHSQMVRSMVAMALGPYAWFVLLTPVFLLITIAGQYAAVPEAVRRVRIPAIAPWCVAAVIAIALFAVTIRLIYSYAAHMPHVPDELSYLFQSKVFAAGRLWAPAPAVQDSFQFGTPPLIVESGDKWGSVYPFGHPAMLALGARVGAVWLIPPLVGAACVVLVFAIGRRLYGTRVGLLAALLFGASPFVLMTASNFMSHNTTAFYLLSSILFLTLTSQRVTVRRQIAYGVLAGVFFGMVFNTRQLTGVALTPPFALLLLAGLAPSGRRTEHARQIGGFAAGGLLMLVVYLGFRWLTTGDPFVIDPAQGGENTFGFGGGHSVAAGIANEQTQMAYLMLVLNNAPIQLGLVLALLPFALGTRLRWDWFFLAVAVFVMGAYTLYYYNGLMHGPRFWYETTPLLMLLVARGVDRGAFLLTTIASAFHARFLGARREQPWASVTAAYLFVALLALLGTHNWLVGDGRGWVNDFVPSSAAQLKGFNGINDRLVVRIDEEHLDDALVLVEECPAWWCFGNVYWRNSPWLEGDVLYARDLPERNPALFAEFPNRRVYVARYYDAFFGPYGSSKNGQDDTSIDEAPRASTIPVPTPVPSPTPDLAAGRRRDEQRVRDLDQIAGLLARYHEEHGAYPEASNVQSLCWYPGDAGCALEETGVLPRDPDPNDVYWYQSNGAQFTVFASFEEAAPASACPQPVPEHLAGVAHLYCVAGANGAP